MPDSINLCKNATIRAANIEAVFAYQKGYRKIGPALLVSVTAISEPIIVFAKT